MSIDDGMENLLRSIGKQSPSYKPSYVLCIITGKTTVEISRYTDMPGGMAFQGTVDGS